MNMFCYDGFGVWMQPFLLAGRASKEDPLTEHGTAYLTVEWDFPSPSLYLLGYRFIDICRMKKGNIHLLMLISRMGSLPLLVYIRLIVMSVHLRGLGDH